MFVCCFYVLLCFFFFKQKTAYEMRISDWSSDVCSSDLIWAAQGDIDMGGLSIWHWLIVGILVLLLFGNGRFSDMMGDVAKGITSFKKGMTEDDVPPAAAPTHSQHQRAPTDTQTATTTKQPTPIYPSFLRATPLHRYIRP